MAVCARECVLGFTVSGSPRASGGLSPSPVWGDLGHPDRSAVVPWGRRFRCCQEWLWTHPHPIPSPFTLGPVTPSLPPLGPLISSSCPHSWAPGDSDHCPSRQRRPQPLSGVPTVLPFGPVTPSPSVESRRNPGSFGEAYSSPEENCCVVGWVGLLRLARARPRLGSDRNL